MRRFIFGSITHAIALVIGFALGIYFLPILIAPETPDTELLREKASAAVYSADFSRDLRGSDFLHWGEGKVSVTPEQIVHEGALAPGPDYKLYLVKDFVEHEEEFEPVKQASKYIGDVKTFDGFLVDIPEDVDIDEYSTVLVWCETFSEFITAAKYR
ncbi:MAG: DM13 domain-containing protein [Pseudomonadota bacterium]